MRRECKSDLSFVRKIEKIRVTPMKTGSYNERAEALD
jgi:hypothetical protein